MESVGVKICDPEPCFFSENNIASKLFSNADMIANTAKRSAALKGMMVDYQQSAIYNQMGDYSVRRFFFHGN